MKARDGKAADSRRPGARRAACGKRESRTRDEARRGAAGLIRRLSCHVRVDTHADRETDAYAIKNISSDYPAEDGDVLSGRFDGLQRHDPAFNTDVSPHEA